MRRSKGKRSASSIVGCAPRCAEPHAERPRAYCRNIQRRQTMDRGYHFVRRIGCSPGLHRAIGAAEAGREAPRFLGTVGPQWAALSRR